MHKCDLTSTLTHKAKANSIITYNWFNQRKKIQKHVCKNQKESVENTQGRLTWSICVMLLKDKSSHASCDGSARK